MKKILLTSLMVLLLAFTIRDKSYAQTPISTTQYFRIINNVAYPITQQEAESLVGKTRSSWNYKTNTIYSKASPSKSVARMTVKYTTVISGGRPQFDLFGIESFSPQNNYNASWECINATGDVVTYEISYSDMLDSGTRNTSFTP